MANKLITQFTPIANPAGTRLITLGDETTGERFQISIADFFALIDSGATFTGNVNLGIVNTQGRLSIKQTSGTLTGGITLEADDDTGTAGIFRKSGSSGALTLRNGGQDALQISGDGNGLATFSGVTKALSFGIDTGSNFLGSNKIQLFKSTNGHLVIAGATGSEHATVILNDIGQNSITIEVGTTNITMPSLAGTGTRNVVVDANGKMSAP